MAKERRARGEGTLRQRTDGAWEASLDLGPRAGGGRVVKWFRASTKSAVLRKRRDALDQVARGQFVLGPRMTVAQWFEHWLDGPLRTSVQLERRAPLTAQNYRDVWKFYVEPAVGGVRLADLSPADVDRMTGKLREAEFAPNTVRLARTVLRAGLTAAEKEGYVRRNAVRLSDAPAVKQKDPAALDLGQAHALLGSLDGNEFGPLITVALLTGLRRGELLGLRWSDVDWENRVLRVSGSLGRVVGEGLVRMRTKTDESSAEVPLVRDAVSALRGQRDLQDKANEKLGESWEESGYVFTGPRGGPMDPPRATRSWNAIRDVRGLPSDVTFHGLRHTTATLLFASKVPMETVSKILRHTSVRTTADTYVKVSTGDKAKALARLQRALDKG